MAAGPGGAADDDGRSGTEGHRPELLSSSLGTKKGLGRPAGILSLGRRSHGISITAKMPGGRVRRTAMMLKRATPAEITAANKRKSEGKSDVQGAEKTDPAADPEDEEYLRTLWTSAKEAAHGDPSPPKISC